VGFVHDDRVQPAAVEDRPVGGPDEHIFEHAVVSNEDMRRADRNTRGRPRALTADLFPRDEFARGVFLACLASLAVRLIELGGVVSNGDPKALPVEPLFEAFDLVVHKRIQGVHEHGSHAGLLAYLGRLVEDLRQEGEKKCFGLSRASPGLDEDVGASAAAHVLPYRPKCRKLMRKEVNVRAKHQVTAFASGLGKLSEFCGY